MCRRDAGLEDLERFGGMLLCADCRPDSDGDHGDNKELPTVETESGVMPAATTEYDFWIPWRYLNGRKQPDAIYADTDNQMSWSNPKNWTDHDRVQMVCQDPKLEGPGIVLQHETDPYADWADPFFIVDYDDVRDPDSGEVHPVVADHVEQAGTYADVSVSGTGVHILAIGRLPEDVKTIQKPLPDHDAFPDAELEVYDGKRFVAMTGEHVVGTPTDAVEAQSFLDELVDDFVEEEERRSTPRPDAEEWEPEYEADELDEIDETDDLQAVLDAIRRVKPRHIRLKSSITEERSDGTLSFDPSWEHSASGTRLGWDPDVGFIYRRGDIGLDPVQVVALEERIITSPHHYPEGEDWFDAVDALRDRGAHIPEFDGRDDDDDDLPPLLETALETEDDPEIDAQPTSALPLEQLDALAPEERRRAARERGIDWPSTDEARDRLQETIHDVIRNEDQRIVDAPTALGKSFTVATERWDARPELTGERPVVHLLETRDARDEAIEAADRFGGTFHVLRGRHEACPVCAGEHDPDVAREQEDRQVLTVDGEPASDFVDRICDGKGLPFSVAHQYVADHNDQDVSLPCGGDQCDAVKQWEVFREGPEDLDYWPLVIATHNFAYAPGLRMHNNVVVDELPDYRQELSTDRIRRAVTAYLQAIDAPVTTWEGLVSLSQHDGYGDDAAAERDALESMLWEEPAREWYLDNEDAHVLAPALARAVFWAEERSNGRRHGKTPHEPPRLEAQARDDDGWNREWVSIVLDERNELQTIRVTPDFSAARSVIGLDAHPAEPVWQANTVPWIHRTRVLDPEERQLWRRYERGLRVVQVGDATRPLSGSDAREWLDDDRLRALLAHLREQHGSDFRTAITTAQVEDDIEALMYEAGIRSPDLMHYGEEKSRNDFADEEVGLVNGCMDPGDDYVLDLLAELDLDAEVETETTDEGDEYRAHGRGFEGDDSDEAAAILASVRENHVAQAAGRWARNADDVSSTATVYVRTDAAPEGFVDVQTPGVEWTYTELQRDIVDELKSATGALTTRAIADAVECSKEHVRSTLTRLAAEGVVDAFEGGEHGATLYAEDGTPNSGVVDVDPAANHQQPRIGSSSTWSLAVSDPTIDDSSDPPTTNAEQEGVVWDWRSDDGGGPPS